MSWESYFEYRQSDVPWIRSLPSHWRTIPLKFVARLNPEKLSNHTDPDFCIQYIDINSVDSFGRIVSSERLTFGEAPSRARRLVRHGDTIISTVRTYLKAVALIDDPDDNVVISTGFAVLRPNKYIEPRFLWRLVQSQPFIDSVEAHSDGVSYPAISSGRLGSLPVWVPPIAEQNAIASFLDREISKIDDMITNKKYLIDLLEERRYSLITQAVTRGIRNSRTHRESNVWWIGEIPRDWNIYKLKFTTAMPLQYGANEPSTIADPEFPRYVRITDIKHSGSLRDDTFRSLPPDVAKPYLLQVGDLLFARSGATVGKSIQYRKSWGPACFAGYLIRARIDERIADHRFIYYYTKSAPYQNWLSYILTQATIANISAERYGNLKIPIPSKEEQTEIVEFLDQRVETIDSIISDVRISIERLMEYRTALITAAVVGEVDVRQEVKANAETTH